MSVYVDRWPRMAADTAEELWDMARRLRLPDCAFLDLCYLICPRTRAIALSSGAIELSRWEMHEKLDEIHTNGAGKPWKLVR